MTAILGSIDYRTPPSSQKVLVESAECPWHSHEATVPEAEGQAGGGGRGKSKQNMQSLLGHMKQGRFNSLADGRHVSVSAKGETYLICLVGAHLVLFCEDWIVGWKGSREAKFGI